MTEVNWVLVLSSASGLAFIASKATLNDVTERRCMHIALAMAYAAIVILWRNA